MIYLLDFIIPLLSSFLFRLGGWGKGSDGDYAFGFRTVFGLTEGNKWFRWLMGLPIGILYAILLSSWTPLLCIATYWIVTSALSYGDNSWLSKRLPKDIVWLVYGAAFGLASFPVLGLLALLQAFIGAGTFWFLMNWSNHGFNGGKLDQKYVELAFGFLGTILYWFRG